MGPHIHHHTSKKLSNKKITKSVDTLAYVFGIGGNVAVVPQVMEAWRSSAPGLAIQTWVMYTIMGIIWLVYAILHKSKPLIIAQVANLCANTLVVAGWIYNHWFI